MIFLLKINTKKQAKISILIFLLDRKYIQNNVIQPILMKLDRDVCGAVTSASQVLYFQSIKIIIRKTLKLRFRNQFALFKNVSRTYWTIKISLYHYMGWVFRFSVYHIWKVNLIRNLDQGVIHMVIFVTAELNFVWMYLNSISGWLQKYISGKLFFPNV